jgi:uncharacterized membrane protein (UPF0127 family)
MYVINRSRGTYLGVNIKVADSFWTRLVGLYAHRRLRFGDGVWLVQTNSIQTIGLRTAIDLVFLDARLRVVHTIEHVPPGRVIWRVPRAHSTLEVPPDVIHSSATEVGDQIEIVDELSPEDQPFAPPRGADGDGDHLPAGRVVS